MADRIPVGTGINPCLPQSESQMQPVVFFSSYIECHLCFSADAASRSWGFCELCYSRSCLSFMSEFQWMSM